MVILRQDADKRAASQVPVEALAKVEIGLDVGRVGERQIETTPVR